MKTMMKLLAAGASIAALAGAAPAAAQYYPGYGAPYGYGYSYAAPGYGYSPYGYGANSQLIVNQCANAVQARLAGGYGGFGYGYGYGSYGAGRVLGISRVEQGFAGAINVHGVATSGRYGGGYTPNSPVDLIWKCRADYRGAIIDIDIHPAQPNYGGYNYTPWNYDYSQYGYTRY